MYAGLVIFSVLGFMAYEKGVDVKDVAAGGEQNYTFIIQEIFHKICRIFSQKFDYQLSVTIWSGRIYLYVDFNYIGCFSGVACQPFLLIQVFVI